MHTVLVHFFRFKLTKEIVFPGLFVPVRFFFRFYYFDLFVSYDRDANSQPCLKRGHRSHWALLTGELIK